MAAPLSIFRARNSEFLRSACRRAGTNDKRAGMYATGIRVARTPERNLPDVEITVALIRQVKLEPNSRLRAKVGFVHHLVRTGEMRSGACVSQADRKHDQAG